MEFERVTIDQVIGLSPNLNREEFFQIPLERRIILMCEGRVHFFKGDCEISPLDALRNME